MPGPLLRIGNTTSRVDFGCDPGEWTDAWSRRASRTTGRSAPGHRAAELAAVADLLGLELTVVNRRDGGSRPSTSGRPAGA